MKQETLGNKKAGLAEEGGAPESEASSSLPMHRLIYEELLREIQHGSYKTGDRLPSEALLCARFSASRITVAKAIHKLQSEGLVHRVPGSGTYIQSPAQGSAMQFGLLIPELGTTEIFEPICRGMMKSPAAKSHSLIWGHSTADRSDSAEAVLQLCHQFIDQKVAGVFFAPIEYTGGRDRTNRDVVAAFDKAKIPIVLLDRSYEKYPDQPGHDLIGVNNHRAGFTLTRHLLQTGAKRLIFLAAPQTASTVDARIAGYREALSAYRQQPAGEGVYRGEFSHRESLQKILDQARPDGIVCANDVTAATVMQTLLRLGIKVPEEVRIIGMDDVSYAKFLPVPLTTLHQNCAGMGALAICTMLERLASPSAPPREILLPCHLVVRESCGIRLMRDTSILPEESLMLAQALP